MPFGYLSALKQKIKAEVNIIGTKRLSGAHQLSNATEMDRYPEIFQACANHFGGKKLKILSFGCSTGEECVSILKYMPNSEDARTIKLL